MSEYGYSETSSIFTSTGTFTSLSSTIPGIGALSGKAIKRFGSAVVNGVDAILIRRRLAQIEAILGQRVGLDNSTDPNAVKSLYSDLLELSRPVYSLSIRTRAFRLIMGKVGGLDVEDLAAALVSWPLSESYDLLKAMMLALRSEGDISNMDLLEARGADRSARLDAYYAAGLDAYKNRLPYASLDQMSRANLCMAFFLFLGLTISLSPSPAFSRLAIELDLLGFVTDIYPGILESKSHWPKYLLPAQLVLCALLEKLDPVKDTTYITRLQGLFSTSPMLLDPPSSPSSEQTIVSPTMSKAGQLSSIRSNITYLQASLGKIPYAQKRRILLLGSGESGKTTLMKQMKKSCSSSAEQSFTDHERAEYIEPVLGNAFLAIGQLETVIVESTHAYDPDLNRLPIPTNIWDLRRIAMDCSLLFYLQKKYQPQYTDYFFDCLPRILSKGYLPSDEDIIRCYIRTTGIHSETINVRGSSVTLLDSGGQQSERKKWKYAFPKTGVVIFVASLSDYNEVLFEDETINRMQDSLTLFDAVINTRSLDDVPVILFLNKTDLFAQKLRNVPLKDYFPDYTGGDDYNAGCGFIIDKFLALNKRSNGGGDTRVYLTSIIDEEQIKNIMDEIYDTFMDPVLPYMTQPAPALGIQVQVQVSVSTGGHEQ